MEEKKGYVEHIIYRNQENGYTVFEFASQEEAFAAGVAALKSIL